MQYSLLFRGVAGLASVGALSSWLGLVPGMESFAGYNPLAANANVTEVAPVNDADARPRETSDAYVARYQASGSLSDGLPALPFPNDGGSAVNGSPASPPNLNGLGLPPVSQPAPQNNVVPPNNTLPRPESSSMSSFEERYTAGPGAPVAGQSILPTNQLRSESVASALPGESRLPVANPMSRADPRTGSTGIMPPDVSGRPTGVGANMSGGLSRGVSANPNALPNQNAPSSTFPGGRVGDQRGPSNYEAAQAQLQREQGGLRQSNGSSGQGFAQGRQQPGTPASQVAYDSNGRLRNFDQGRLQGSNVANGNRQDPRTFATGAPFVSPPPRRQYATSPYDHGLFMNAAYQRRAVAVDPRETSAVSNRSPGQLASTQAPLTGRENLPQYQQAPGIYPTAAYQCNPAAGVALGAPTLPPPGNVPGQAVPPTLTPNLTPGLYSANNNGYSPLLSLGQEGYNVQIGRGVVGQPTVYVPGQPVRNFLRYLSP